MIIDQITLAGADAYLAAAGGQVNLAQPPREGRSVEVGEGMVVDVTSLSLQLDRENILDLFDRQAQPIFSVEVVKEMFPGLFSDPYGHRVHRVEGFGDFNLGTSTNLRVMEVEGVPALVSAGDEQESRWLSAVYKLPGPLTFDAAAWEMPTSRLTPEEGFNYDLRLFSWVAGQDVDRHGPSNVVLAQNAGPGAARNKTAIQNSTANVIAYQFEFKARVKYDAFLRERHTGHWTDKPIGRPLLTSVNLLERVESSYSYRSLQEVIDDSLEHRLIAAQGDKPRRLCATLNLAATLAKGERIVLRVQDAQTRYLAARLNARVLLRPPQVNKG